MAVIVGVHGVGNYMGDRTPEEAAAHLSKKVWTTALYRGLGLDSGEPVAVAYYAHHLQRGLVQGADDPDALDEESRRLLDLWDQHLCGPQLTQGWLTRPPRQIIAGIARHFGLDNRLVELFVMLFLSELRRYFGQPESARLAVRAEVAATIRREQPQVLIAHSLGSVVAYETLWAEPELAVELLVTVGSPLGLPDLVFERLQPAPVGERGSRPPGVRRWVNLADPGDLCAVPRWLSRRFTGIEKDHEDSIHSFDFHKVVHYLRSSTMADIVRPYLAAVAD